MNLAHVHLSVGQTARLSCPECSGERRKRNSKDLSVTNKGDALVYLCHHCGVQGLFKPNQRKWEPTLSAVPKTTVTQTPLTPAHYNYLQSRGISAEVADKMKLFSAEKYFARLQKTTQAVGFPYYRNGALTAAKYRSIEDKDFTQDSGGAHDFFGIDNVVPDEPIVIVEGEIDALTLLQAGVKNGVSVPGGAPLKVADGKVHASEDKRFSFVWNAFDTLSAAPWVIIATDNDGPGQALAEELARRIGKDKCKLTKFERKDLNEVLLQDGAEEVRRIIESAEPYPVAGLSSANQFMDRLNDLWNKGTGRGFSTGFQSVDDIYTVVPGQLTVVTGYPSSGKSNFVDQLMVNLARNDEWKFALCSFENAPEIHISRLIEIYTKKKFFEGSHRMSEEEFKQGLDWVNEHFTFMTSESSEPATIDSILTRAKVAVARMGIRGIVIDPYNYIDMDRSTSETDAISNMLTRIQAFAKSAGVHVWFVAHPSKMVRSGNDLPRPDGMAIAGSMAWWAKADCGLTVHREEKNTQIAVWKCRYRWVGTQGETVLEYDKVTGTYREMRDNF